MNLMDMNINIPQIKICGMTRMEDALACADLGADAVGFVFYENSPRYMTPEHAGAIIAALPENVLPVGVFVNASIDAIVDMVTFFGIKAIQLHGNEPPRFVEDLLFLKVPIIKALYMKGEPCVENAFLYNAASYLVECEKGILPGGNAMKWNWEDAADFGEHFPFILAGGLSPDNVAEAICATKPDAVDVSSGVEASPGIKDIQKIRQFILSVKKSPVDRPLRSIFHESVESNLS
jgi:phosphoribosylanthranilate isomerase